MLRGDVVVVEAAGFVAGSFDGALEARVGALSLLLGGNITGGVAELQGLIDRVKSLESRPSLKYSGVWNADTQNNEGEFVTCSGSVWYCRESTRDRPGTSDAWQLAVKRGNDGKDSR